MISSEMTLSGIQIYSWALFFVEGGDEIKFYKPMQMKQSPFAEMALLRRSLTVVISAVGVYFSP